MGLGTEGSLGRKEASAPPSSAPSPLSSPQPRSPEGPPGLRARGSARHGRRRRPGADGRGGSERRLFINPRRSRRRPPAKSNVEASAPSFEQTSKLLPPGTGRPGRVAPSMAPQRAQLPASSRLSERRGDKEGGRLPRGRRAQAEGASSSGRGARWAPSGGRAPEPLADAEGPRPPCCLLCRGRTPPGRGPTTWGPFPPPRSRGAVVCRESVGSF